MNQNILELAEKARMTLPLDALEDQWRKNANEFVDDQDYKAEAFEQVAQKISDATSIRFSIFETELFLSGVRIEEILHRRQVSRGKLSLQIQPPPSTDLVSIRSKCVELLNRRLSQKQEAAHRRSKNEKQVREIWEYSGAEKSSSVHSRTVPYQSEKGSKYRIYLTSAFCATVSIIVLLMIVPVHGPDWLAPLIGLSLIVTSVLMVYEYRYSINEPRPHPLSSIWQKSAWATRQGEHLGFGVVIGIAMIIIAVPFFFSGPGGRLIALCLVGFACGLLSR